MKETRTPPGLVTQGQAFFHIFDPALLYKVGLKVNTARQILLQRFVCIRRASVCLSQSIQLDASHSIARGQISCKPGIPVH